MSAFASLIIRQNALPSLAPPGIVPNTVSPDSIGGRVVVACPLLGSIAILFVFLRFIVKWRVIKIWGYEDLFILFGLLFAITRVVVEVLNAKLRFHGRHVWDIPPQDLISIGNKQKGMMAFIVIYLILFFFLFAFNCNPPARTWYLIEWTGGGSCFNNIKAGYAVGGINHCTDVVLLVMPLPLLWQLKLGRSQNIGLLSILCTGLLVVICTIVREIIITTINGDFDQSRAPVEEIIWLTAELCVGIICACLPCMAPACSQQFLSSLIPTSLQSYIKSLRLKGSSSSQRDITKKNSQNSDSEIELVRSGYAVGYANTGTDSSTPKGGIQQTTDITVNFVPKQDVSLRV
ncbi:hypothetical protein OIDMADRAFT_43556 [Oidiodendron maius Zn]|uniref:Rhodopsin domain-containing protein n=1 Tax=Oidiodendron maius (strain Zn) TaxID=913774 RepID=A0A0C3D9X2_OIDMZ|nr:hypothetical protein OIDMADRAFT_43556 [Oidiodendron maius Zn]